MRCAPDAPYKEIPTEERLILGHQPRHIMMHPTTSTLTTARRERPQGIFIMTSASYFSASVKHVKNLVTRIAMTRMPMVALSFDLVASFSIPSTLVLLIPVRILREHRLSTNTDLHS